MGPCRIRDPDGTRGAATLFTDASGKGYGGVLFTAAGEIAITAGRWSEADIQWSINVLEARALRLTLGVLHDVIIKRSVGCLDIRIDNTSALGALLKTQSPSWALNKEVQLITASPLWGLVRSVQYVRSEANLADLPSRLDTELFVSSTNPFCYRKWCNSVQHLCDAGANTTHNQTHSSSV